MMDFSQMDAFCDDNNMDVTDTTICGFPTMLIFDVEDFDNCVTFCDENEINAVFYKISTILM